MTANEGYPMSMLDEQDAIEELFSFAQHPMAARDAEAQMFRSAFASVFQNAANARYRASKRGREMRKGQARRRNMPRDVVPLPGVNRDAPPKSAWDARQEEIAAIYGSDPDQPWKRGKRTNPFVDCGNSTEVVVTALERCTVLDRMSRAMLSRTRTAHYDDGLSRGGEFSRARKPQPQPNIEVMVRAHRRAVEAVQLALIGEGR